VPELPPVGNGLTILTVEVWDHAPVPHSREATAPMSQPLRLVLCMD